MFGWFKSKVNVLPNDIEKALMSSVFVEIKLGSKIVVPNNVVCFVSYKDKIYLTLKEGTYSLDENNINALIIKQKRNKSKIKTIKLDLFFVNKSVFNENSSFTINYPINKQKTKVRFEYLLSLNIEDENKFKTLILSELALPDANSSKKVLFGYVDEFIYNFFLRKNLTSVNLPFEMSDNLKTKLTKFLLKLGVKLNKFELKLYPANSKINKNKLFFETLEANTNDSSNQKSNSVQVDNLTKTLDRADSSNYNSDSFCPNCKIKRIKNSQFCHKCGYKF